MKKSTPDTPKIENGIVQLIRMDGSTSQIWVNRMFRKLFSAICCKKQYGLRIHDISILRIIEITMIYLFCEKKNEMLNFKSFAMVYFRANDYLFISRQ